MEHSPGEARAEFLVFDVVPTPVFHFQLAASLKDRVAGM
jgi:hypothetical protein